MPASRRSTRRQFLTGLAAGGAASWVGRPRWSLAGEPHAAPNDQLRIGVIGVGVRGKYLIGNLPPAARVVAICDCAQSRMADTLQPDDRFAAVLARFRETAAARCTVDQDYRRLLDRPGLDAVVIATPDHHHAPAALRALQAGLDVYLEKPLTLTIGEGRPLVDLVRRTRRVLQVGSQQRTMEINRFACEWLRSGGLGKISRVDLPNYPGPLPAPNFTAEPIPHDIDWSLFCGPAPLRPYHPHLWRKEDYKVGELLWRGWDLFRDYSGHLMTNWGAHAVDMVQYALGRDDSGPVDVRVEPPAAVEPIWRNWRDKTPPAADNSERRFWPVTMRYVDGVELRFAGGPDFIVFHGERGRLKMWRNYFETDPPDLVANGPDSAAADLWKGAGHVARPHLENWLECVRSRGVPNAPVEVGHRSATVCHLANLARELNRPLTWDPVAERFTNDAEANLRLDRPRRAGFSLPG